MASHQERSTLVPGASVAGGVSGEIAAESDGVRARGYWEQAWIRLRRDRIAVLSGIVIIVIVLVAFIGAPLATHLLGHGPNDINPNAIINYAAGGSLVARSGRERQPDALCPGCVGSRRAG